MDEKHNIDDTFLGRWIDGRLTNDELAAFKKTKAYKQFSIINKEAQLLESPNIDIQTALKQVKSKIQEQQKKPKVIKLWYSIAAAAIVVISLGIFFNSSKTYNTTYGEQLAIVLPDGSKVQLNANSKIEHKRFYWTSNRQLKLQGEAYFDVEKGADFVVNTNYGNVSVLGTKFNIRSRKNSFELKCFEGSVRFDNTNKTSSKILKPNDGIRIQDDTINTTKQKQSMPNWINNKSIFQTIPLKDVLEELEAQFGVQFKTETVNINRTFSGAFTHASLEQALETTLVPMGITYKFTKNDTKIITLE